MSLREIFHAMAVALATAWLSETYRQNPEIKYVYTSDLFHGRGFPMEPEMGKCIKITLEITDDPRMPKPVAESIPQPFVDLSKNIINNVVS